MFMIETDPILRSTPELPDGAPSLPDVSRLKDSLEVAELSKATVGRLRASQTEWLNSLIESKLAAFDKDDVFGYEQARKDALLTAHEELSTQLVEYNKLFLGEFIAEDDPAFRYRLHLLNSFSVNRMSDEEWYLGEQQDDGSYDRTKSGQEKCFVAWKKAGGKRKVATAVLDTSTDGDDETGDDDADEEPDEDDTPDPAEVARAERVALAAEKAAEMALANGNLDAARNALAEAEVQYRTKGMFARKKHSKAQYQELKQAYEDAMKTAVIAGFEHKKADRIANDQEPFTAEEINKLAQSTFATEFGEFTKAQNELSFMTNYGKKARKFGEVSLKRRLLRSAAVLGAGAVGMATGGIFAAGMFGVAAGLRVWQTKSAGTVGHSTAKGTERITQKINKKNINETNAIIDLNTSDNIDTVAEVMATGIGQVAERTRSSNSRRRKMVPILIGSALVGGALKGFSEYESSKDTFAQVKQNLTNVDWNPFRTHDVVEASDAVKTPKSGSGLTFSDESTYINEATPTGSGSVSTGEVRDSLDNLRPSGSVDIGPELADLSNASTGINPATGDLFRSDLTMSVLDGKGFAYDVESAGIVPKGYGVKLAEYLHTKGFDNGAHIPGFKNLSMWHTSTGTSVWSTEAARALAEFKAASGL
jgi:hypothetical protein